MKKKDIITFLEDYNDDTEIIITDGFNCRCYRGNFQLQEWKTEDGNLAIDIGVGGNSEYD